MQLRLMRPADIPAGLRLCRAARWNQLAADWRCFLEMSPQSCLVAEIDGRVAATVATLPYGWISMVLVDPAMRHRGIGSTLLKEALRLLSHLETVRLDATPAGKIVYDKFGFMPEYALVRLIGGARTRASRAETPLGAGRPTLPSDLPHILELDRAIFGADRSQVLRHLYLRAPQYAFVHEDSYCFGRPGHNAEHIGPVVASDQAAAKALISACLSRQSSRPYLLDVVDDSGTLVHWLRSANWVVERPFVRMCRGPNRQSAPTRQFAIAGPEFG